MSLRRSSRTHIQPAAIIQTETLPSKKRARRSATDGEDVSQANGGLSTADSRAMPPPSTPVKKRKLASTSTPIRPPPLTPTPSAIGVMLERGQPANGRPRADENEEVSLGRPVEPHHTNATLVTPRGTQVISTFEDSSPSRISPLLTTSTLLQDACKHLISVDPKLKPLIDRHHCKVFSAEGLAEAIDPFEALVSGILSQQVSGAAARSIKNKFIALYTSEECPNGFPLPAVVAETDLARLRTAGLSQRKAEYVQGLAQKFALGELTVQMLMNGSDDEVMEKLVAVRGLGVWSVQMFMCFALKRMDIFSTGDLGIQRGMAAYMGRDVAKLKNKGGKWKYMSEQDMIDISDRFKPYRSLFMWYMWRIEDVDTAALESS